MCHFLSPWLVVSNSRKGQPVTAPPRDNPNEEKNTVFHSYSAYSMHALTSNMYVSMSYTGFTMRYKLFIFLWLRHRNT